MITLLKTATEEEARLLERKAFLWAVQNQNAKGGSWSEVYSDKSGFGITFEPSIVGAFTKTEMGETKTGEIITRSKVETVEQKVTDSKGDTTGTWEVKPVVPPAPK